MPRLLTTSATTVLLILSLIAIVASNTSAQDPPTDTPAPTSTVVPPTNTLVPPTDTPIQPTNTSVPPTVTPVPPTATNTPLPATNTPVPPTATNTPTATATNTAEVVTAAEVQTLTLNPAADARVAEVNPAANFGTQTFIQADGGAGVHVEAYLRFVIPAFTGSVTNAKIRLWVTNPTGDGPDIYAAGNNWTETGINWNNRTTRISGGTDNKATIPSGAWVEYNVTSLVNTFGVRSFVLAGESTDGVDFNSRENVANWPELVLTIDPAGPSAPTPTATGGATFTPTPSPTTAPSTLTFTPQADSWMQEGVPNGNNGASMMLRVDGGTGVHVQTIMRFAVSGVTGSVQSAKIRLWVTNGTADGPAIYSTINSWTETAVTWNNRPAPTSGATDDKGPVSGNTFVEFNVLPIVTTNGTYSFLLIGESTDGIDFNSRENAANKPELILQMNSGGTPAPTNTPQPPTVTPSPSPTSTPTLTPSRTPTSSPTSVTNSITVNPVADARVDEVAPNSNFGTQQMLRVDGGTGIHVETFLRFSIPQFTGSVTSAKIRLWVTNPTGDGPAINSVGNGWTETGINWNNRPPSISGQIDNKAAIPTGAWVEYNVTPLVTTWGVYSYRLAGESTDGIDFNARESASNRPELVVTINPSGPSAPSPTVTPTPAPTSTPTPTPTPNPAAMVVVAVGDIACGDTSTGAACEEMATSDLAMAQNPAAVLLLGDNQYECGEIHDYMDHFHPSWGRLKPITHPAIGNHEYSINSNCPNAPDGAPGTWQYFGAAANPLDPSCTVNCQGYYSFDIGAWHVIAINSNCSKVGGCGAGTAEEQWLRADLAAHANSCTLAYFHHPRFSSGAIGDNASMQAFWQALYDGGAELVLVGHDHNYERFAPMNASGAHDTAFGVREFVVGTGGRNTTSIATIKPNSEIRDRSSFGVLKLTLRPNGYDWQFIPIPGNTFTDSGSGTCHGAPGGSGSVPSTAGAPVAVLTKKG